MPYYPACAMCKQRPVKFDNLCRECAGESGICSYCLRQPQHGTSARCKECLVKDDGYVCPGCGHYNPVYDDCTKCGGEYGDYYRSNR